MRAAQKICFLVMLIATPSVPAIALEEVELLSFVDESFVKTQPDLKWGRDPFLKMFGYSIGSAENSIYKLNALIYSEDSPKAIINGQIVAPGSTLNGGSAKVEKISSTYVVLRDGNSLIQITQKSKSGADKGAVPAPERKPATR